ncbi:2-octaprenylphenol hydroxylase [Variibacter gotjawalensis]|uniref:2-octaprenylphenol hydroxylase n=1 Tax=Variibacter gotjawalensis TaxID=1333996 RepID=A0A0S3PYC2_9BRAD|nr:NAD(P)/FAD-dependent oxidoreductase [Variibacter gotjawalensis]NIK46603.1 2-polyprenyl-6-methoxyphenol hydroxylase-like FAD-dependent oxidoreductase [Variibacter gotjawalensis]RZS48506.1 2-polyprenyl-6-methoxyphenol hydroxylase-like FAD-dependent oxidoreductase [Variibacter gotjawalensis]BAT60768.1 2-octaprenylphenol hydroxylase [Variibacter gotjawalensis]
MDKLKIGIVGAGPAGLAVALRLHRAGHAVTIFERFDAPKPVGSGLLMQPTGLTVLHSLGLLSHILALGARIERLHGSDALSGRTVLDVRYGVRGDGRFGLAVHRAALFGVLYDAVVAERIPIATSQTVEAIEDGMLFDERGQRIGAFDLVIDASGARSRLRRYADVASEPKPLPYGAFWASLDWREGFDATALVQRYRKASVMIGVLPIGRAEPSGPKMAAFFWSLKPGDAETVKAEGLDAWKARVLALWPECSAFLDQIVSFDQLTLARYGHHTLQRPAARKLAIIGDAAHSASPQLGQGANMALLDAAALAHAIEQTASVEDALAAYCGMRHWHIRAFQALSFLFTPFYQSDSTLLPIVRDRLVAVLATIPPGPQVLAAMVAGTLVDPFARIGLREYDWRSL